MVLTYYAQVHVGWLPFTENKGENVANYLKEERTVLSIIDAKAIGYQNAKNKKK